MSITVDREEIKNLFDEAILVMSDCEYMKSGLADLVKSTAEKMDIKPASLNKALKIAYKQVRGKGSFDDDQDEFSIIEELLVASGRVQAGS